MTGEGGTNHGTFHECLNIAGAWKLPLVVVVENNAYAISVPFAEVTATPSVAERAAAYGAWGRRVDGCDVEAVAAAFAEAAAQARSGGGPAVLEATCSRFRGHYEGDHDGYRPREERARMRREKDPLPQARDRLLDQGLADTAALDAMARQVQREIDAVLAEVRADPLPDAAGALDHVLAGVQYP